MSKKVIVVFSNDKKETKNIELDVLDNPIAEMWFNKLKTSIEDNLLLEKDSLFYGWPRQTKNELAIELNEHIGVVRDYFKKEGIDYELVNYSIENDNLNVIHSYFEQLHGVIEDINPIFKNAPPEVQYAIRKINTSTHKIEIIHYKKDNDTNYYPWVNFGFMEQPYRQLIPEEYYKYFEIGVDYGGVYLHYSQVGKTHYEVYFDKDDIIMDGSIQGTIYVSGEFDIPFYGFTTNYKEYVKNDFFNWWKDKETIEIKNDYSIDYMGKPHPVGWCKVAQLNFLGQTEKELIEQINNMNDVVEIIVDNGVETVSAKWDYEDQKNKEIESLTRFMKKTN